MTHPNPLAEAGRFDKATDGTGWLRCLSLIAILFHASECVYDISHSIFRGFLSGLYPFNAPPEAAKDSTATCPLHQYEVVA